MTGEEKLKELDKIIKEIRAFKDLEIAKNATNAVPGEGSPDAQVMFIGEAPGFHEDQQGRPFVGAAGKLLEKALTQIGLTRSEVYITNIVKFRPPENRDPFPEEIKACQDWLDRQISIIEPQIIATLGRFSMAKFLGPQSISKVHGEPRQIEWSNSISNLSPRKVSPNLSVGNSQILVFPMFHPAAALRAGDMMRPFVDDFQKLGKILKDGLPRVEPLLKSSKPITNPETIQPSLF